MYQEMNVNTHFNEGENFFIERAFNYRQKIVLVDGCPLVMQGIEALLNTLCVPLSVDNLSARDRDCNSVLLDNHIDMVISGLFGTEGSILNGFISLDKLKKRNPEVKVVVVTQTKNKSVLGFLVNMGMDALISCDDSLEEIIRIITDTLQNKGKRLCSQKIRAQLPHLGEHAITSPSPLTGREITVINAFLAGNDLQRISRLATRSAKTMSYYKRSAMRKLRVNSNAKMLQSIKILAGQSIG